MSVTSVDLKFSAKRKQHCGSVECIEILHYRGREGQRLAFGVSRLEFAFHVWRFPFGISRFVSRFALYVWRLAFRFAFRALRLAFGVSFRASRFSYICGAVPDTAMLVSSGLRMRA